MKSLIATLFITLIIFGTVLWNSFYINTLIKDLNEILLSLPDVQNNTLPETPNYQIYALQKKWKDNLNKVSFSTEKRMVTEISQTINSLACYYENGDIGEYQNTKQKLFSQLEELQSHERIQLMNIL